MVARKICVVTGANSGIGKELCIKLARLHYIIVMGGRNLKETEKAKQEIINKTNWDKLYSIYLDLADFESIEDFANEVKKQFKVVDILVNNAGLISNQYKTTKNGIELHSGVNYVGHFYLTKLLLVVLEKSKEARIINISSKNHKYGKKLLQDVLENVNINDKGEVLRKAYSEYMEKNYSVFTAYPKSKYAMILFSAELSYYLKDISINNVYVFSVNPGVAKTNLGIDVHKTWKGFVTKSYVDIFGYTAEQAAENVYFCCVSTNILSYNGFYMDKPNKYTNYYLKPKFNIIGKKLWEFTSNLLLDA